MLTKDQRRELASIYATLDRDEMHEASELLRLYASKWDRDTARQFTIGMPVSFRDRAGEIVTGTVTKVNKKTVAVQVGMVRWKVSPGLLTAA